MALLVWAVNPGALTVMLVLPGVFASSLALAELVRPTAQTALLAMLATDGTALVKVTVMGLTAVWLVDQ